MSLNRCSFNRKLGGHGSTGIPSITRYAVSRVQNEHFLQDDKSDDNALSINNAERLSTVRKNIRLQKHATMIRPFTAPHGSERQRCSFKTDGPSTKETIVMSVDMQKIIPIDKEAKTDKENNVSHDLTEEQPILEKETEDIKDRAPVFNRRLFASQGAVIITKESQRLMLINENANRNCDVTQSLSKAEFQCLRCVVDGLQLIHKNQDYVKDVLSQVVSYEIYRAHENVLPKHWEDALSCYYILNGAVEVIYDIRSMKSRSVYQANIIYNHGTGEYLGLVSSEGPTEDLSPPAKICTKELTQFIRIDRQRFHILMKIATRLSDKRKRDYIAKQSFLQYVTDDVKEKIVHKLSIQESPANSVLLKQGETTEYICIVMSGRCLTYRAIYVEEADRNVLFNLTSREPDDFFGEECVLDQLPSLCTVVTATATKCLMLPMSALKLVNRDKLTRFIENHRHEIPTDDELRDRGYKDFLWNKYKHAQVKVALKEDGKLQYLSRPASAPVRQRPDLESELQVENMRQFVLKGSQFHKLRPRSIKLYHPHHRQLRQQPLVSAGLVTDTKQCAAYTYDDMHANDDPIAESTLIGLNNAKELEHCSTMAMKSSKGLLKILDEKEDQELQLKQAWKLEETLESPNFMRNGMLTTMTSEDIVRKAKALADTSVDKWTKEGLDTDEDWDTILHAENKQAKLLIVANQLRMKELKRRMAELQKQRERNKTRNARRPPDDINDTTDKPLSLVDEIEDNMPYHGSQAIVEI